MSFQVEIDADAILAKLQNPGDFINPPVDDLIAAAGEIALEAARAGAPQLSGALASGMSLTASGFEALVEAPDLPETLPMEFGFQHGRTRVPGRFFMHRALMAAQEALPGLIATAEDAIVAGWEA